MEIVIKAQMLLYNLYTLPKAIINKINQIHICGEMGGLFMTLL